MNYLLAPIKFILAFWLVLSTCLLFGQNLVLNPGFESAVNVQCDPHSNVGTFASAAPNWSSPSEATPDVFSSTLPQNCPMNPFTTSFLNFGQQAPRTGNRMAGFHVASDGFLCTNYREYLQGTLSSELVVGQPYEVEFYVNLGESSNKATNNIGIKFSTGLQNFATTCTIPLTPDLVENSVIDDTQNWVRVAFCYVPAQANLKYFIIGNFNDNPQNTYVAMAGPEPAAYYFIDDVSVRLIEDNEPATTALTIDICSNTEYNLYDQISQQTQAPTTGVWTGQSNLSNGYLGTFNTATNMLGTYTYTWESDVACAPVNAISVTLTNSTAGTLMIDPIEVMCESSQSVPLNASIQGGVWSGTGVVGNMFNPTVAGAGNHTIRYEVQGFCLLTAIRYVQVIPAPIPNVVIHQELGCAPLTVRFTVDSIPGMTNEWLLNGNMFQTNVVDFTHTFNQIGCHTISYSQSLAGCTSSVSLVDAFCVTEPPIASFTATALQEYGELIDFQFTNNSQNALSYQWDFGGYGISNSTNPIFNLPHDGSVNVCLIAILEEQCRDTICQKTPVANPLLYYIPNAFTPDDNEYNQVFKPVFTSGFDPMDYNLIIFDRWGEMIFESNNSEIGWDGTYNGKMVQDGTYTWRIEFKTTKNDERVLLNGHVIKIK